MGVESGHATGGMVTRDSYVCTSGCKKGAKSARRLLQLLHFDCFCFNFPESKVTEQGDSENFHHSIEVQILTRWMVLKRQTM